MKIPLHITNTRISHEKYSIIVLLFVFELLSAESFLAEQQASVPVVLTFMPVISAYLSSVASWQMTTAKKWLNGDLACRGRGELLGIGKATATVRFADTVSTNNLGDMTYIYNILSSTVRDCR